MVGSGASLEHSLAQIYDLVVPVQYGGIYVNDGSTVQTIEGAAEKLVNWASAAAAAGGVVSDAAGDKVTVGTAGVYMVFFQISWTTGLGATAWIMHVRVNGVESGISVQRSVAAAGRTGSASALLPINLPANAELEVYIEHPEGVDRELTMTAAQLSVVRVGS